MKTVHCLPAGACVPAPSPPFDQFEHSVLDSARALIAMHVARR